MHKGETLMRHNLFCTEVKINAGKNEDALWQAGYRISMVSYSKSDLYFTSRSLQNPFHMDKIHDTASALCI